MPTATVVYLMIKVSQLDLSPGDRTKLKSITWQQYKSILDALTPHRSARATYDNGRLEIMVPHQRYEDAKEIASDLIKALLEELNLEFRALGSTTFERQADLKAIEPDQCFYIQNESAIRGKSRIDLAIDPPPDLALEIDTAARTHVEVYEAIGIPELWRFSKSGLAMYRLQLGQYTSIEESEIFPGLPLRDLLPYCMEQSRKLGRNVVMRDFRQWVRSGGS